MRPPAVFPSTLPASDNPLIYLVDGANNLLTIRADAPGTILSTTAITGLAANERVEAIDFRPATGQLYALGLTPNGSGTSHDVARLFTLGLDGALSPVGGSFTFPAGGAARP